MDVLVELATQNETLRGMLSREVQRREQEARERDQATRTMEIEHENAIHMLDEAIYQVMAAWITKYATEAQHNEELGRAINHAYGLVHQRVKDRLDLDKRESKVLAQRAAEVLAQANEALRVWPQPHLPRQRW